MKILVVSRCLFLMLILCLLVLLPFSDEKGCYYALDLGGTNFRVMRVKLQGNRTIDLKTESYKVPPNIKVGKLHELFDYIAEKICHVIETETDSEIVPGKKRELGFTFSFPVQQTRINSGTLINWTKDYNVQDAIGKDMVKELTRALEKRAVDVNVTALLNDTVGALAGGRFYDSNVVAAVVLGTGTNAAYLEQSENILKPYGPPPESGQMVINTEWGNFNSPLLPLTEYDHALDSDSPNRHKQILEKMVSGRYLGEIVRRILERLADDAALFGDIIPPKLRQHYVLATYNVVEMHSDKSTELSVVEKCLEEVFEISDVSLEKKNVVVKICDIVATRSGRLGAAAIMAILKRLRKDTTKNGESVVVAVDGSLFETYKQLNSCLQKTLSEELVDEQVSKMLLLKHFKDASGIGAAVVAASHSIYT
ncbi:hexokinase-1-like isoform X2 [Spinacia oleracea]|uniref:Phosphotransferase n=1 Tax=Spinacia oleracea TaxID=3562 RepID=A0ABM3RTY8_SPIOL|nr:hexokinase-1-like isoform X2 [Spinacia oleracea]